MQSLSVIAGCPCPVTQHPDVTRPLQYGGDLVELLFPRWLWACNSLYQYRIEIVRQCGHKSLIQN